MWSDCTGTCGMNNLRFRSRTCAGGFGENAGLCGNDIDSESEVGQVHCGVSVKSL